MEIRNAAIIAHVDHGKTTLINQMFMQSNIFRENQKIDERVMDSNDLEKERGITILAKCTSMEFGDYKINIIDTPGHADFGGEVERVLTMVDGVVLLVDAAEGPMPQTKFVLNKALKLGLKPIVVINKVDRSDARVDEVLNEVFDLFVSLDASDEQLDFAILYASGRSGWATYDLGTTSDNLNPLFETIVNRVPKPKVDHEAPFKMLVSMIDSDNYLGRILIGRVYSGKIKVNSTVKTLRNYTDQIPSGRLTKMFTFRGIERLPAEEIIAGDIVAVAGIADATVADTICVPEVERGVDTTPIDPPTMAVTIGVNDSPIAGREGSKVTSNMIRERLFKEAEGNVAIKIKESDSKESFEVGGRGELQLGVLIETMRREGFELSVSRPKVIYKRDPDTNQLLEPIEELFVDVDDEHTGIVVEKISMRKGDMIDMRPSGGGKTRIIFQIPSRGLIGYQSEFLTDTRGTGVMSRIFHSYAPHKGEIQGRRNGVLISMADGEAVTYALWNIEERGILFIGGGEKVYTGMIIGQHSRDNDLEVNPLKGKQLTNFRTTSKDEAVRLTPPKVMTLEEAISYIETDELVEVTPKSIRIRKIYLDPNERKRANKTTDAF